MNKRAAIVALPLIAASPLLGGCDALRGLIGVIEETQRTGVQLRNQSDFAVEVVLFYDDDQETVDGLIQETGTERNFTVVAGGTQSFSRPCDDLQAVIIDDADLLVIGEVGPEDRTDVLRDGDEFDCGDTIVFTFDHSDVVVDFEITTSVNAG